MVDDDTVNDDTVNINIGPVHTSYIAIYVATYLAYQHHRGGRTAR